MVKTAQKPKTEEEPKIEEVVEVEAEVAAEEPVAEEPVAEVKPEEPPTTVTIPRIDNLKVNSKYKHGSNGRELITTISFDTSGMVSSMQEVIQRLMQGQEIDVRFICRQRPFSWEPPTEPKPEAQLPLDESEGEETAEAPGCETCANQEDCLEKELGVCDDYVIAEPADAGTPEGEEIPF